MSLLKLSVILCTHNPRADYFNRVLKALAQQTLPYTDWELLIIDNASKNLLADQLDLSWHPQGRIIRENTLGLTPARLRGVRESRGQLLVFVDDDNVLGPTYLTEISLIAQQYSQVGAFSGKSIPEYEISPEPWIENFHQVMALRDLGEHIALSTQPYSRQSYPDCAPVGAGMVIRRAAFTAYFSIAQADQNKLSLGRKGSQLTSGEDNDIILTILEHGWRVGYFPQLSLTHLISANRLNKAYMAKLNQAATRSWVQVLDMHGIRNWPKIARWSVIPRKLKSFLAHRAWKNTEAYIHWCGSCGLLEGQANLS